MRPPGGSIGSTGAREGRRAARRQELLDAAHRVIRRDGPHASMDDVAAEAGITKPILYRHFGDKGGLYRALAERYVWALLSDRRTIVKQESDGRTRVAATIDAYLSIVDSDPQIYRFLAHHALHERPEAQAAIAGYIRTLATDIAGEIREGLDAAGADSRGAEAWAYGIIGMVQLATDWWLEERPMPRSEFVEHLVALLWDGLASPKAVTREVGDYRDMRREQEVVGSGTRPGASRSGPNPTKVGGPLRGRDGS